MAKIKLKSTSRPSDEIYKKIAIHGRSGIGKTMLAATAAGFKPLIILTEKTGDESLQPESIRKVFGPDRADILYEIDLIEAYEPDEFEQAVQFAQESEDHDLVIFDSFSKASRLILKVAKSKYTDGRKAYGEHNDSALDLMEAMTDLNKHSVYICHTTRIEDSSTGEVLYYPGFEGKALVEKFVYELAHVLFLDTDFDDDGEAFRVLRAHQGDTDKFAKNRGGKLNEIEEPHIGRLIAKLCGKTTSKKKIK
jgi:hypothetical protein